MGRISQLEAQVRGLMQTIVQLHEKQQLDALDIPRPDIYVDQAYIDDLGVDASSGRRAVSRARISQLENQIKGLMETVIALYEAKQLDLLDIPRPDQYINEYEEEEEDADELSTASNLDIEDETEEEGQEDKVKRKRRVSVSNIENLPRYSYSPLNASSAEIRLLALEKNLGGDTDAISCRLVTASLDNVNEDYDYYEPPPIHCFTTLSYCWGEPSMTHPIILDGKAFLVTESLYNALLHFRTMKSNIEDEYEDAEEHYWWIDAICINQGDLDERKSQVTLMSRLYKQAQTVHVWLGQENTNSAQAMRLIRDISYLPTEADEWESWMYVAKPGQKFRPVGPGMAMRPLLPDMPSVNGEERDDNYSALIDLYQRPWFSRVWIRQEIALPERVKVHCGQEICDWEQLIRTADILSYFVDEYHVSSLQQDSIHRNGFVVSCFREAVQLHEIRQDIRREGNNNYGALDSFALRCRNCDATDPRDKVYAMLPLVNPDEIDVRADYRKPAVEVFRDVTLTLLKTSLDYLSGCHISERADDLPSWVPDLQIHSKLIPTSCSDLPHDKCTYNHWGDVPSDIPDFTYNASEETLNIRGVLFDAIRIVNHDLTITNDMNNAELRATVRQWREFLTAQRDHLFQQWDDVSTQEYYQKRAQYDQMFDPVLDQKHWESTVLQNLENCEHRALGGDELLFKRWNDNIDHDPVLKKVGRLLPLDPKVPLSKIIGRNQEYFAQLRKLAVGRCIMMTSRGGMGLVPSDALETDEICFFDGTKCPFVIRRIDNNDQSRNRLRSGDDIGGGGAFVIVGQACELKMPLDRIPSSFFFCLSLSPTLSLS